VIVCILFSKKKHNSFCSFVRSFILHLFFQRTSYDWTSEIFQDRPMFFFLSLYTHIPFQLERLFCSLYFFLLRVVILKEKRIYICVRVCVFFFIAPFFSLPSNQNKQTKIVSVHVFFFLSSVTNFKQKR
jgi:hypothetical protein